MTYLSEETFQFARRVSQNRLTSDWSVANGEPIKVFGFIIRITAAAAIGATVTITNGTDTMLVSVMATQSAVISEVPFVADQGLTFSASAQGGNIAVTVFHTQPGS